ncbi:MAG: LytR C-terminal domain-containing protein [Candidatus Krumholzibacteria bacterium]|nr:LytR C-terminal domain-containing protein [Candidatus Krumholzibacteria bacterium]
MTPKRKKRSRAIIVAALFVAVAAFSLAVRWLGLGTRFVSEEEPFQIEVLNGTKEGGAAMEAAKHLRRRQIDVLVVDNAERFDFRESVLVDRKGNPRLMRRLAKMLDCRVIVEQVSPAALVDASYIVGYDRLKASGRGRS